MLGKVMGLEVELEARLLAGKNKIEESEEKKKIVALA